MRRTNYAAQMRALREYTSPLKNAVQIDYVREGTPHSEKMLLYSVNPFQGIWVAKQDAITGNIFKDYDARFVLPFLEANVAIQRIFGLPQKPSGKPQLLYENPRINESYNASRSTAKRLQTKVFGPENLGLKRLPHVSQKDVKHTDRYIDALVQRQLLTPGQGDFLKGCQNNGSFSGREFLLHSMINANRLYEVVSGEANTALASTILLEGLDTYHGRPTETIDARVQEVSDRFKSQGHSGITSTFATSLLGILFKEKRGVPIVAEKAEAISQ